MIGDGRTDNKDIASAIPDIRAVGDLERIRTSTDPEPVDSIVDAMDRLVLYDIIPRSARAPRSSVSIACGAIRRMTCTGGNQDLLKRLLDKQKTDYLKPFTDLVIRLWLLCPPSGLAESMESAIRAVFDKERRLSHADAAKELIIRWNGPDPLNCDSLVNTVEGRYRQTFDFSRRQGGTAVSRRLAEPCDLSALYS